MNVVRNRSSLSRSAASVCRCSSTARSRARLRSASSRVRSRTLRSSSPARRPSSSSSVTLSRRATSSSTSRWRKISPRRSLAAPRSSAKTKAPSGTARERKGTSSTAAGAKWKAAPRPASAQAGPSRSRLATERCSGSRPESEREERTGGSSEKLEKCRRIVASVPPSATQRQSGTSFSIEIRSSPARRIASRSVSAWICSATSPRSSASSWPSARLVFSSSRSRRRRSRARSSSSWWLTGPSCPNGARSRPENRWIAQA